jgi:predicted P-loop ATPase
MWVTFFADLAAQSMNGMNLELDALAAMIANTQAPTKAELPLLSLCRYGGQRTNRGSLRHDNNVISCSGVAVDYDGEIQSIQDAVDRMAAAGIRGCVYPSPSYTPAKPRWRGLLQFSKELPPAEYARMVSRANGVLGGGLARESWVISQAYYFGSVGGTLSAIFVGTDEEACIDELEELDATAQPYRAPNAGAPAGVGGKTPPPDFDTLDEFALRDLITIGQHYYRPAVRLLDIWARAKVAQADAETNLLAAFDAVPAALQSQKWKKARANVPKWIAKVYARVARQGRALLRALVTMLDAAPPWQGTIRFNELHQQIEVAETFPPQPGQVHSRWRALEDPDDLLESMMVLQESGFPHVGKGTVRDALIVVARRHSHDPIRAYLDGLVWDGQERIGKLFLDYFPTQIPNPLLQQEQHDELVSYYENTAQCFMVGAVARAYRPGEKVDTLPVLVGPQGWNKSHAARALCPEPAWFGDDVSTALIDRDTKDSLVGKWIVELAEFPHIRREIEKVKSFFSRQTDRFRRAYAALTRDWPRRCVFIATTNELEFIDTTGNRRFWPVQMHAEADVKAVERDRDQLWAEAVHWYGGGYKWWLPPSLEKIAAEIQGDYLETDAWDDKIADWLAGRTETTGAELLTGCLGYALSPSDGAALGVPVASRADQMRVANCLKRAGWRRNDRGRSAGRSQRSWVPNS